MAELTIMEDISLAGLNKADVLAALYNAAKPQGMGFLEYDPAPMTREEAAALLERRTLFDYIKGRVLKVFLEGTELNPWGYDKDNGQGCAAGVIAELRTTGDVNASAIQAIHREALQASAEDVRAHLADETLVHDQGDIVRIQLGLSGVADTLGPAVEKAVRNLPRGAKPVADEPQKEEGV